MPREFGDTARRVTTALDKLPHEAPQPGAAVCAAALGRLRVIGIFHVAK